MSEPNHASDESKPTSEEPKVEQEPSKPPKDYPGIFRGVALFLVLNAALAGLAWVIGSSLASTIIGISALVINIVLMVVLTKKKRPEAKGMLWTFVVLVVGAAVVAPCFLLSWCSSMGGLS